jgi:ABC-2 type transport system permease protein
VTTVAIAARPTLDRLARLARTPSWVSVLWTAALAQLRDRSRTFYILSLIQPATFLSVTLLARRHDATVDPAAVALGSGLVALWGSTIWSAGGVLRSERRQGTLSAIVTRPVSLAAVLVGKSAATTLQSAAFIGLTVTVVAAALGHPVAIAHPLAFTAALAAVFVSASALGLLLGCVFLLTRAAARISEALMYPVFILAGLIVPITLLPEWARPLSWFVSLRWGGELLRAAARGTPQSGSAWVLLTATTAAYVVAGRWLLGVVLRCARKEGTLDLY